MPSQDLATLVTVIFLESGEENELRVPDSLNNKDVIFCLTKDGIFFHLYCLTNAAQVAVKNVGGGSYMISGCRLGLTIISAF
jgi:hypothetical protein